jgi:hypothetical protein
VSEPRRRKGRGIDAIFDSTDLDLGPTSGAAPQPAAHETGTTRRRSAWRDDDPGPYREEGRSRYDSAGVGEGGATTGSPEPGFTQPTHPEPRRSPGRPPSRRPPGRELVQRGFYLEVDQDRMLDETKAALKKRGFTPDRSAIVRAALQHFVRLDRVEQEGLVRRAK